MGWPIMDLNLVPIFALCQRNCETFEKLCNQSFRICLFNIDGLHVIHFHCFQYGPNQYGLVVYGTIGHTPEPAVHYVKETRSAKQILQYLDDVRSVFQLIHVHREMMRLCVWILYLEIYFGRHLKSV